jgi:methyl-accepting chemotaxis protein
MIRWFDGVLGRLSLPVKLALLVGIGLLTSLGVTIQSVVSDHQVDEANARATALARADAALYHLDNRNSELKVDAYRSIVDDDKAQVQSDATDDIASVDEVMADLQALAVADLKADIAALAPRVAANNTFVRQFVDSAARDVATVRGRQGEIEDSNHALDDVLDGLREKVDTTLAADRQETLDASARGQRFTILVLVIGSALAIALGAAVSINITRRLRSTGAALEHLAARDVTAEAPVAGTDEIARMAIAVNGAVQGTRDAVEAIDRSARGLSDSSGMLAGTSHTMADVATRASADAEAAAVSSERLSAEASTVAGATVEINASIADIARGSAEAAQVAAAAVASAATAEEVVSRLGHASSQIGSVVQVITTIADQTNLLALNATIEAARAGQAGAGFAVVANQVKELSMDTARATGDITTQVDAIQQDTAAAVSAIAEITTTISRISESQESIAAAVEEQTATTNDMSRSLGEVAEESARIAGSIGAVSSTSALARAEAADAETAASQLAAMAEQLEALTATFRFRPDQAGPGVQATQAGPGVQATHAGPGVRATQAGPGRPARTGPDRHRT